MKTTQEQRDYAREYHATHKDEPAYKARRKKGKAEAKKDRGRKHDRQMKSAARFRAKKNGVPYKLQGIKIELPTHCPALGIELDYSKGGTGSSPSLDRIIPSLGYVLGNIAVISKRANTLKSDCIDPTELRKVANWLEQVVNSVEVDLG